LIWCHPEAHFSHRWGCITNNIWLRGDGAAGRTASRLGEKQHNPAAPMQGKLGGWESGASQDGGRFAKQRKALTLQFQENSVDQPRIIRPPPGPCR
jgi:hypothetical protein